MTTLVLDSSGSVLAVALQHGQNLYEVSLNVGFNHTENIMVLTHLLLQQSGLKKEQIELIVCPKGPGSFTGLRIAIATAKGLSLALQKPLVMIDTLQAYSLSTAFLPTLVVLDARKNRFYGSFFEDGVRQTPNFDLGSQEIDKQFPVTQKTLVTGYGASLFLSQLPNHPFYILDPQYQAGKASFFIDLALQEFALNGASLDQEGADYLRLAY